MDLRRRAELISPLDELTIAGIITMWQTYRRRSLVVVMPAVGVGMLAVLGGAPKLYDELVLTQAWLASIGAIGFAVAALVVVAIAVSLVMLAASSWSRRALRRYGEVMDIDGDTVDAIVGAPPMIHRGPVGTDYQARNNTSAQDLAHAVKAWAEDTRG